MTPDQTGPKTDTPQPDHRTRVPDEEAARFRPHASREMAGMFDEVSGRYDLLNRVMTLNRDEAWRDEMTAEVPGDAHVVVDLCTGSGISTEGLQERGRLVIGFDVSFGMLERADHTYGGYAWGPRFVCADGFRLPLADVSADALTVAFGMRNLRPRADALKEIARVLRPGGTLSVLEATAPGGGWIGRLHGLWIRHVIPLAGRLSPDPSAYRYLSDSIFDFGSGPEFQRELAAAGFDPVGVRRFMLGAAKLWVARRMTPGNGAPVQIAMGERAEWGDLPHRPSPRAFEWRLWTGAKLVISTLVLVTLVMSLGHFMRLADNALMAQWQRSGMRMLLIAGVALFSLRSLILLGRLLGRPPRR